jgi:glycerol uptake facilitator-like aquaporin
MLIGQLPIMRGVCYIVAQVLACVLAALIAWALLDNFDEFQPPTPNESSLGNLEVARAFFAEMIFTGALVSVVLHVACSRQRDNQHYGLAIGVTLVAIIYAAGEISGGSFNPAVATALHLQKCFSGDCWAFRYIWIYWVAPALGACLAAFIFGINQKLEEEESGVYIREREKKTGRPPKGASAQKSDGDVDATDPKANDLVE